MFLKSKGFFSKFYSWLPIVVLYVSVLNEFDVNYLDLDFFSFNFPFILIFFFTLKDFKNFDYLLVFLAGLINDTVVGLPLGLSSLSFMIICIATSYFRNITIRPNRRTVTNGIMISNTSSITNNNIIFDNGICTYIYILT